MSRRIIKLIATVFSVCLIAQGCVSSLFDSVFSSAVNTQKKVPESAVRFHINGEEYYRDSPSGFPFVAVKHRAFEFYEDERGMAVLYASIRNINQDGTPGSSTGFIEMVTPSSSVYQGALIKDFEKFRIVLNHNGYYADPEGDGDECEMSFALFNGYNPGDSIRVKFSFDMNIYESSQQEGKEERDLVGKLTCTDGVFKEVAKGRL